jgi:hypothetical protein
MGEVMESNARFCGHSFCAKGTASSGWICGLKMGVGGVGNVRQSLKKCDKRVRNLRKVGEQRSKKLEKVFEKCEFLQKICFERTSWASAALRARIRSSKYFSTPAGGSVPKPCICGKIPRSKRLSDIKI